MFHLLPSGNMYLLSTVRLGVEEWHKERAGHTQWQKIKFLPKCPRRIFSNISERVFTNIAVAAALVDPLSPSIKCIIPPSRL